MKNYLTPIIALLITSCSQTKDSPLLDYQLSWEDERIDFCLDYIHPQTDTVTLYYGSAFYGGQLDIFTCVKNLKAEGATLIPDSANMKVKLTDFTSPVTHLTYSIKQRLPEVVQKSTQESFRPNITHDFFISHGINLFFRPEDEEQSMRVSWSKAPDFPVFCLYNPGHGTESYTGKVKDFLYTALLGDRMLCVDTVNVNGVNNYVVTAPRVNATYNRTEMRQFFTKAYSALIRFWEADSIDTYSLIVYPFEKVSHRVSGTGLNGGFLGRYNADADTILDRERANTFVHEIGHNWISAGENDQWWGEGFNEMQTMYMIVASGITSVNGCIDYINEALDKLYHSKIRNLPNDSIASNFWNLGDYSWIPYWRGEVYAFRLMGQIEKATGNKHTFKDFMMAMKPHLNKVNKGTFLDVAQQFLDRKLLEEEFDKYIMKAETMTFQGDPMPSGCEVNFKEDGTPYIVITDEEEFKSHFIL